MSRDQFTPPGWPAGRSFVIGWDDALEGYFALVLDGDGQLIASAGEKPPKFVEPDNLMRVINARIKGQLPPVQLTGEHRKRLAADAKRPVVNAIAITSETDRNQGTPSRPDTRPVDLLGTLDGFLDADGLRDVLDDMAETFRHLETFYRSKSPVGVKIRVDARDCDALQSLGIVCHLLDNMVQTPGILVAAKALAPFREIADAAGRILAGDRPVGSTH